MSIELNNESGVEVDEAAIQRLAAFALDALHVHADAELAIVLVDEGAMEQLHVRWMDEPGPTDVLSFPMDELRPGTEDEPTPAGCSFHPRCPVAVASCGWEARDLRALLERRWLEMPVEQYAKEKALFADLEALAEPGPDTVTIAPGKGHSAQDVLEYLRGLREEASATEPREPFWNGVVTMHADGGGVVVQFEPPQDPRLRVLPGGEVRVACHLYSTTAVDS